MPSIKENLTSNSEIRKNTKTFFKENWKKVIPMGLFASAMVGASSTAGLFVWGAILTGSCDYFLQLTRGREPVFKTFFSGFKSYKKTLITNLLLTLRVCLWSMLFMIPGIIRFLMYSQVYFILNDNPDMNPKEALELSKDMMDGAKSKFFLMLINYWLLSMVCVLTFGLGFAILIPYIIITNTAFYEDLREKYGSSSSNRTSSSSLSSNSRRGAKSSAISKPVTQNSNSSRPAARKTTPLKTAAKQTASRPAAKKSTPKKTTTSRPAAKKSAPTKTAAKKTTTSRPAAKKSAPKKTAAKKTTTRKPAAKKAAPKKSAAKKTTTSKPAAKKAAPKKTAPKKTATRKPAAKKAAPKKSAAKKTTARKPAAKKTAKKS